MTFKEFTKEVFRLPAKILSAISTLVLGGYHLKNDGSLDKKEYPGLLGLILEGGRKILDFGKWIGRATTKFFKDHEKAIASAFWLSLLVGAATALTVAFWPAALAFVVNLSIAGYSIASIVGGNFFAQVAGAAAVATILTNAAVYTVAAISNFVRFITSCGTRCTSPANEEFINAVDDSSNTTANALNQLGTGAPNASTKNVVVTPPVPSVPPILSREAVSKSKSQVVIEETNTETNTAVMGNH